MGMILIDLNLEVNLKIWSDRHREHLEGKFSKEDDPFMISGAYNLIKG